jgi:hypothetical protein
MGGKGNSNVARLGVQTPWETQNRARALAADRAAEWPYPWVHMPQNGRAFNRVGSVEAPPYGDANTVVVTGAVYTVPVGYVGVLTGLFWQYVGTGFVNGSGNVIVTIDVNTPLNTGGVTAYNLPDYSNMRVALGLPAYPWSVSGGWMLDDGDTVRVKAYTVATVGVGAPNYVLAGLQGWIWPNGDGQR